MRNDYEYDDKPPSAATTWSWFGWFWSIVIGSILVIGLIGLAFWAFDNGTSGIKGKSDVKKQNNSGSNQIAAQSAFSDLYNAIQGDFATIKSAASDLASSPDDTFKQSVLTADKSHCRDDVAKYNGYALDTTMRDWRPSDLPANIDLAQCEVTK